MDNIRNCGKEIASRLRPRGTLQSIERLLLGMAVATAVSWSQNTPLVFKKDVTFDELPSGIEKRFSPGTSATEVRRMLSQQPSIVLDGVSLIVTPPAVGSSRSIAVKSIELRNGARIISNGVNLEIDVGIIVSNKGSIISFDQTTRRRSGEAAQGSNGRSGLSAGAVILNGTLRNGDILVVSLPGQDGERGGLGYPGAAGAAGARGENGSDHLFDCAHGGGNGGNGSAGGKGGSGGNGGAGGDGGRLILRGDLAKQRGQIDFSAPGGLGGEPGTGGPGGPGGPGGAGGSGTTYCRGGSAGAQGPGGPIGDPGVRGADGRVGTISSD